MDTIIAGGTVVTASETSRADVGIAGGRIVAIGEALPRPAGCEIIDASGRYVLPGAVDTHTHLDARSQVPTADDFLSGTIAAACGGTTSIVDFCGQSRGGTLGEALAAWHGRAAGRAVIDYGFHMVVVDATEAVLDELLTLPDRGVTSFKLFMAYKGRSMVDDATIVQVLDRARRCGANVLVHAENGEAVWYLQQRLLAEGKTTPKYHATSRPPRVEAEATARAIALGELVGAPVFIVHVSCREALAEIERARARGVAVQAETCSQYLFTTEADLDRPGFEGAKYVFTPPPRTPDQPPALWQALASGALQSVSSDHSAFRYADQKTLGREDFSRIPNGAPGIEERLTLLYQGVVEGRISLNRFVALASTNPARMFGLHPRKGTLAVGADADLVVFNPAIEWTISQPALHHKVDYTLYEGRTVRGAPETVLLRGQTIVRDRQFVGQPGTGRFLHRAPFSPVSIAV